MITIIRRWYNFIYIGHPITTVFLVDLILTNWVVSVVKDEKKVWMELTLPRNYPLPMTDFIIEYNIPLNRLQMDFKIY